MQNAEWTWEKADQIYQGKTDEWKIDLWRKLYINWCVLNVPRGYERHESDNSLKIK